MNLFIGKSGTGSSALRKVCESISDADATIEMSESNKDFLSASPAFTVVSDQDTSTKSVVVRSVMEREGKNYVTSDLHGFSLQYFRKMLEKIDFTDRDRLYILGDCIDRGCDSISLLEWIASKNNVELLMGNHEDMMLGSSYAFMPSGDTKALDDTSVLSYLNWMVNGGKETLQQLLSIEKDKLRELMDYLREIRLYKILEINGQKFLLVHAGLGNFEKNKSLDEYTSADLLWHRPECDEEYFDDIKVVLGHTPTVNYGEQYKGRAFNTRSWINIDVGEDGFAPMILRLEDMKEFYFDEEGNLRE